MVAETNTSADEFLINESKELDTIIEIKSIQEDGSTKKVEYTLPSSGGAFKQYDDKEDTAFDIASALLKKACNIISADELRGMSYRDIMDNGSLFFLSTGIGLKHTGLLSLCPTLLTAIKLWGTMRDKNEKDVAIKEQLLDVIKSGIEVVFRFIYRFDYKNETGYPESVVELPDDDDTPVFDASPYELENFTPGMNGMSYIDSISWAVPLFLRIMTLKDKESGNYVFEKYRAKSRFLTRWCLDYVNNSLIYKSSEKSSEPQGWNFVRIPNATGNERSLYYTYAASTVYLSFLSEYKSIIDLLRNTEDNKVILGLSDNYWTDLKVLTKIIKGLSESEDKKVKEIAEKLDEDFAKAVRLNGGGDVGESNVFEMFKDLMFLNENKKITDISNDGGRIFKLKWALEIISEKIWADGERLEKSFMYEDFNYTEASEDAIRNSGQTNALFSGLLQIGIILNAGYDLKISAEPGRKGRKAYEGMQNIMLIHVQKTQRFYDKLVDRNLSFGVESLIMKFGETELMNDDDAKVVVVQKLAERLRKYSIRVNSLTPMLLKTNNLVSKYIVQYPQKQMVESLRSIGSKRYVDKKSNEKLMIWETDDYHAISNYYYVGAIFDFYEYQEEYEQQYIKRYEVMVEALKNDLAFSDSVRKYRRELEDDKARFEREYKKRVSELSDKLSKTEERAKEEEAKRETADKLIASLTELMLNSVAFRTADAFKSKEFIRTVLTGMREHLAEELAERLSERYQASEKFYREDEKTQEYIEKLRVPIELNDGEADLIFLIKALIADIFMPSAIDGALIDDDKNSVGDGWDNKPVAEGTFEGLTALIKDKRLDVVIKRKVKNFDG